ncbi:hypothetical protein, partial [Bifidobacterium longum]|uniref:hypothetical protein n=1 Tax=Bifidobacterium longum TaxID=216816 RepID=UPI00103BD1A7
PETSRCTYKLNPGRLAYWLVVMIMVGVTDRHSADGYDDTEPGNIESGDTRIRRALPARLCPDYT